MYHKNPVRPAYISLIIEILHFGTGIAIINIQEVMMVVLTNNEIIDELEKLGISCPVELSDYSNEYVSYFTCEYIEK